jgi:hypothetical protein
MRKRAFIYMLFLQVALFSAVIWYGKFAAKEAVFAYQVESTPIPFLGPIYYGQEAIPPLWPVFQTVPLGACIVAWQNRNFGRM